MKEVTALTPKEVAEILKVSKYTVYEMAKKGEIASYRVGNKVRIDKSDIEEYKSRTMSINISNDSVCELEALKRKYGFVISGEDFILDILSCHLQRRIDNNIVLRSFTGSYFALFDMYKGNVQLAAIHLWDAETGEYNVPYVKKMLPGIPTVVIHLADRMQGLCVAKGNPKGIKGMRDLKRKDISIVNIEKGNSSRVFLDEYLKKFKISSKRIRGYERECISDLLVVNTVARGGGDFAVSNEKVVREVKGVDFIPIQIEKFDLVIKKEDIDNPKFQEVLKIINSEQFKKELENLSEYNIKGLGKIVAET